MRIDPMVLILLPMVAATIWGLMTLWRRSRVARLLVSAIPIALGVSLAASALRAPHGYVASYSFGAAWVLFVVVVVSSLLLFPLRIARRSVMPGIAGACILLLVFYGTYGLGYALDLAPWKHKKQIQGGPDVEADFVIVFKMGAAEADISRFWEETLSTKTGTEHWPRPGIASLLRVRVKECVGIAMTLRANATDEQVRHLTELVEASDIVAGLFPNVAPTALDFCN